MALALVASQLGSNLRVAPALLRYRPFFTSTAAADAPEPVSCAGECVGRGLCLRMVEAAVCGHVYSCVVAL